MLLYFVFELVPLHTCWTAWQTAAQALVLGSLSGLEISAISLLVNLGRQGQSLKDMSQTVSAQSWPAAQYPIVWIYRPTDTESQSNPNVPPIISPTSIPQIFSCETTRTIAFPFIYEEFCCQPMNLALAGHLCKSWEGLENEVHAQAEKSLALGARDILMTQVNEKLNSEIRSLKVVNMTLHQQLVELRSRKRQ